jgi:hypothetical protein
VIERDSTTFADHRGRITHMDERVGRFSTGQEKIDATSESMRIGRFSDGQATHQDRVEHAPVGRFSIGQELHAETVDVVRVGSFGDREAAPRSLALHRQAQASDRLEVETVEA